jgi:hypothetical protein
MKNKLHMLNLSSQKRLILLKTNFSNLNLMIKDKDILAKVKIILRFYLIKIQIQKWHTFRKFRKTQKKNTSKESSQIARINLFWHSRRIS